MNNEIYNSMLQFYLAKIINALNLTMPTSTISVICSIL